MVYSAGTAPLTYLSQLLRNFKSKLIEFLWKAYYLQNVGGWLTIRASRYNFDYVQVMSLGIQIYSFAAFGFRYGKVRAANVPDSSRDGVDWN